MSIENLPDRRYDPVIPKWRPGDPNKNPRKLLKVRDSVVRIGRQLRDSGNDPSLRRMFESRTHLQQALQGEKPSPLLMWQELLPDLSHMNAYILDADQQRLETSVMRPDMLLELRRRHTRDCLATRFPLPEPEPLTHEELKLQDLYPPEINESQDPFERAEDLWDAESDFRNYRAKTRRSLRSVWANIIEADIESA